MRIGTRSVLFGAHAFWLHPWFLAWAWTRLYGLPRDPRLWVVFFAHDLGHWGGKNLDGEEGERHPWLGARIAGALFDPPNPPRRKRGDRFVDRRNPIASLLDRVFGSCREVTGSPSWYCFSLYHSRYLANQYGTRPSRLCFADKMAFVLEPWWLYLPRVKLTGEINEYRSIADHWTTKEPVTKAERDATLTGSDREWKESLDSYLARWIDEHKEGKEDRWTTRRR